MSPVVPMLIDVLLPQEKMSDVTMERLPTVPFKADKPVPFSARIEIIDMSPALGHAVGAAENSTLTFTCAPVPRGVRGEGAAAAALLLRQCGSVTAVPAAATTSLRYYCYTTTALLLLLTNLT